jgi:two-component system, cell cycle sensor histidine kinase and response regulator CckA
MKSPLHILHLEDDPNDAELIQYALEADGIAPAILRVQTRDDFVSALERGGIDLIFSDFDLPAFDGLSAAEIVQTRWPTIPLILVSGSLDEDLTIDSFKIGATDCVPKRDLSRLAPAVRRAMREVEQAVEQRRLQTQVIESQKLELISQLSSGVAHDFNNLLAVIVGYSDLVTSQLEPDSPLQKYIDEIRHASNRAAGLTRQLLVFSRKQLVRPEVINPNDAVKDLDKMLRRLINPKIEITIIPGGQTGYVKADSGHIGQVLMNLVLNARDAMPAGGKIFIATDNVTLDESCDNQPTGTIPGDYVRLTVSDTGTGMTEEVKAHLFEAFFTTKTFGTGLGLATCRTIVQQSGGHIDVSSELGEGTTFTIYLPRVEQLLQIETESVRSIPLVQGTEALRAGDNMLPILSKSAHRILVVDDETSVRQLTTEMLIRAGFQVEAAADGAAGWEAIQAKHYDLVITDNFMPNVTGIEMVKKIHAGSMNLPVIMATAIFPQEEFQLHPWLESIPTLLKPFRATELLYTVRKVLSANDGNRQGIATEN